MSSISTFSDARIPTAGEVRARRNLFIQGWRFAVLNVKMIVMVTRGHH
ncbi:unannotated protein [freshwater metagenome]|uniref:Unannotated protein n=1 Tax=freshwater metagenome TaxID=449393 RepID=A0A6J7NGX1_9ZZZZ|nr:hypothetical protein [Actinomycetota bacterium]MSV74905.1 hypothetical protein [Actinomycetota bacterium]